MWCFFLGVQYIYLGVPRLHMGLSIYAVSVLVVGDSVLRAYIMHSASRKRFHKKNPIPREQTVVPRSHHHLCMQSLGSALLHERRFRGPKMEEESVFGELIRGVSAQMLQARSYLCLFAVFWILDSSTM